jgi:HAD superfamily hydrolase (TIGR01549 family)
MKLTRLLSSSMAASMSSTTKPPLRGVVFDMDGTLTVPNLDFGEMYRRCGVDTSGDILAEIKRMQPMEAQRANAIIEETEEEGRRTLQLMPGALEFREWLLRHDVPMALVTRNTSRTVQRLTELGFALDIAISRDDVFPPKPHPQALHHIAEKWKVECDESLVMIGDSLSNDIGFGKAAGVSTAFFNTGRSSSQERTADLQPDIETSSFLELPSLLWQRFEVNSRVVQNYRKYETPTPTTPAAQAAASGNLKELLQHDIHQVDEHGNTPLIWAADQGHTLVIEALMQKDVAINVQGYLGSTAISRAARRGHTDIVRLLQKADTEIPNLKMQYPLHFAAFKQHPDTVQALLSECGANSCSLDRKGRTAAQDTSNESIRNMILEYQRG